MINKSDIMKMAKHILRRDRGKTDSSLMHPDREWSIGLVIATGLFVCGGLFAADTYLRSEKILTDQTPELVGGVVLEEERISITLGAYADREAEFERIRTTGAQIFTTSGDAGRGTGSSTSAASAEAVAESATGTSTAEAATAENAEEESDGDTPLNTGTTATSLPTVAE